jgi:hypothetical protein
MALRIAPTCPVCDSADVRKSRRRNFLEKLPIIFFFASLPLQRVQPQVVAIHAKAQPD